MPAAALSAARYRIRDLSLRHPRGLAYLSMNSASVEIEPARLLRRQNIAPLILVNLGIGLHATIWYMATTAMPSAVEELDAAAYLSWATSLYLMTSILGGAMRPPIKSRF